jgi:D-3-phosphoglycerate dehydrogenase
VNIATFALGRDREGGSAIALVAIDGPAPEAVLAKVEKLPGVKQAKGLKF